MALLSDLRTTSSTILLVAVASIGIAAYALLALLRRPAFPRNAPKLTHGGGRAIWGAGFEFFARRWDFHTSARKASASGNYSYYVGKYPVVGLSGEESRKIFFENRGLAFTEGYTTLFGGGASIRDDAVAHAKDEDAEAGSGFGVYFNKRLIAMLKGNRISRGLPNLLKDTRENLDVLAANKEGIMNPFDAIYRIVFRLTMRTVACNEIAEDMELLDKCLGYFEAIESSTTAMSVMYPWLPLPSKARRTYAGARMYLVFNNVIENRKKHNRTEDDALQYLMDQGDSVTDIITLVLGALFAGREKYWYDQVFAEINQVADKYSPDKTRVLRDRLMDVPSDAWEGEFPILDVCLKDTIRFNLPGTGFRQNLSGHDIPLNKEGSEVIPSGAFVTLAVGDTYYNDDIFSNAKQWDPARYLPPRSEDKKQAHVWTGWGAGRHPCLGMRFAKLEMSVIVAFFMAYFEDFYVCDKHGNRTEYIPMCSRNNLSASKPEEEVYIKYKLR